MGILLTIAVIIGLIIALALVLALVCQKRLLSRKRDCY
jgi:ABC-type arginine/histidine transport system permease subunit